jgi:glycine/D-amino acid oxidase-like deaminating enzyme
MNRRTLLELFAGVAVSGLPTGQPAPRRVVIAGAGIIGANIAYQLARRGAAVTIVEKGRPGRGATANSFAWINAKKRPRDYFDLSRLGIQAWRRLDGQFHGALPVVWGGSVEWRAGAEPIARLRKDLAEFREWGYPVTAIDAAALRGLEPRLTPGAMTAGAHWTDEAHADPVGVTEGVLQKAEANGARLVSPAEVTGLDLDAAGRLRGVRTSTGDMAADLLVIACGVDTPRIAGLAGIHVPLKESPGVLVHVPPQPRLIERVVMAPMGNIKQKPDGRIVTGSDFGTGGGDVSREAGQRHLETMARVLPGLDRVGVEKMTQGFRPLPADGFPIVGFAPGRADIYLTVMHSGVTLGPLVGELAAAEILDGVRAEPLAPYRPERFARFSPLLPADGRAVPGGRSGGRSRL